MGRFYSLYRTYSLLAFAAFAATTAFAQQAAHRNNSTILAPRVSPFAPVRGVLPSSITPENFEGWKVAGSSIVAKRDIPKVLLAENLQETAPGVKVGYTFYDFQTNACMMNRLQTVDDAGTPYVQMVWMAAKDATRDAATRTPGFNISRGTHYTYLELSNPSAPTVQATDWKKVSAETERTGWPNLVQFKDGGVGYCTHSPVKFWRNDGLGSDGFLNTSTVATEADSAFWPRVAMDGDGNLHMIYNRRIPTGTTAADQVAYRRSKDGGETWEPEILFTGPTGLGSTTGLPGGVGGDTYHVTARGKNVVVTYMDGSLRLLSRKSTDAGATWDNANFKLVFAANEKFIDSTVYTAGGIDSITVHSDTVVGPSSHVDVIIDSDGLAHYVFGSLLSYVIQKGPKTPDAANPRRGTIFTLERNEWLKDMGMIHFREGDSILTFMAPPAGGSWDGNGWVINRRIFSGVSRWPQLGMDANDNIYLAYGSVKNGDVKSMQVDTTPTFSQTEPDTLVTLDALYGHVYLTHKLKNFSRWSQPLDITPAGMNCQFATVMDTVMNGFISIGYGASPTPGDRVTNVETAVDTTGIYFYNFPTSALNVISSVSEERELKASINMVPNPANEVATLTIDGVTNGKVTVSIVTTLGETVLSSSNQMNGGSWTVSIPTQQLASGTYFCLIEQNGLRTTRSLSVIH
ncbi:hypothetical protein BH10BAC6_BH10BAC6_05480 [soil metagenome]